MTSTTASATAYKKLTPREHILVRPDSYIGSRTALETQRLIGTLSMDVLEVQCFLHSPLCDPQDLKILAALGSK